MIRKTIPWRKAVFGVALGGSLAFGATQAAAAPGSSEQRGAQCYQVCEAQCGPEWGYQLSNGMCLCCS